MNFAETESNIPRSTYFPPSNANITAVSDAPPVDLGTLEALGFVQDPGEPDLVAELIGLFLDDSINQLARIEAGVASQNIVEIRQGAHSLKGSSASLGANKVAALCRELESIDDRANWTGVPILVEKLRAACDEACTFLAAERDRRC